MRRVVKNGLIVPDRKSKLTITGAQLPQIKRGTKNAVAFVKYFKHFSSDTVRSQKNVILLMDVIRNEDQVWYALPHLFHVALWRRI
jgi:hypothetical protein